MISLAIENGKPTEIRWTQCSYFTFGSDGKVDVREKALESIVHSLGLDREPANSSVININPTLKRKKWMRENRWELGKEDLDRIIADIWPKSKSDAIPMLKGISAKTPPVSREARNAIHEIRSQLMQVDYELHQLSEVALKGLIYQVRKESGDDPDMDALMLGVVAAAERKLEILKRHRTGRGIWFAIVEASDWDQYQQEAEVRVLAKAKCESKSVAATKARQLLVEHATKFGERTSIEARIACELEMTEEAEGLEA